MKLSSLAVVAGLMGPVFFSAMPPCAAQEAPVGGPSAEAANDVALLGTWRGTTGPLRKRVLVLGGAGVASLDGVVGSWSIAGKNQLSLRLPGESLEAEFERDGKRLTLIVDGKRSRLRLRAEAKAGPLEPLEGAVAPAPEAPFAGAPAAIDLSSWPGDYSSGDWVLRLRSASGRALGGSLERDSGRWEVEVVPAGSSAMGCLSSGGAAYAFDLAPGAGGLVLSCGTERLSFSRVGPRPDSASGRAVDSGVAPALDGIASSPAKTYRDPSGHFSFEMPAGWTAEATDIGLVINPGFKATDTLDALIIVAAGRLEATDRGQTPAQIIDRDEPGMRRDYAAEGIRLGRPRKRARSVQVGSYPGAVQEWKGTLADKRPIDAWVGAATAKGHYITVVGIIVSERQAEFLPHVKRILSTMELNPPDRRLDLERQFVGREVISSRTDESGYFGTSYEFSAGGQVGSQTFLSGSLGLDSVSAGMTDAGEYVVIGTTLYMTFPGSESSFELVLEGNRVSGVHMGGKIRSLQ